MKNKIMMAMMMAGLSAGVAQSASYTVDASHSYVGFSVRHMVVTTVRGQFNEYEGAFDYDPENPAAFTASAVIKTASIDTRNTKRDDHLRNEDFFDAPNHPEITFETTGAEVVGDKLHVRGNLTMRGVTKEITIPVVFSEQVTDPWGNVRIGFEGSTKINRQDWGISWSKNLDAGGLVVSDEVTIELNIQGIQKKEE